MRTFNNHMRHYATPTPLVLLVLVVEALQSLNQSGKCGRVRNWATRPNQMSPKNLNLTSFFVWLVSLSTVVGNTHWLWLLQLLKLIFNGSRMQFVILGVVDPWIWHVYIFLEIVHEIVEQLEIYESRPCSAHRQPGVVSWSVCTRLDWELLPCLGPSWPSSSSSTPAGGRGRGRRRRRWFSTGRRTLTQTPGCAASAL